jgi:hypothetical protein
MTSYFVGNLGWREGVWFVPMSDDQWTDAHHLGTYRGDDARAHHQDYSRAQPGRTRRDQYTHEQQNFLSRMAFCTAMELDFDPQIGITARHPDFGIEGLYVVHSVDGDDRQLLVRPHEPKDRVYVLAQVLSDCVHVALVGWTKGREYCDEFTWNERPYNGAPPLWEIPRRLLHDMEELR